MASGLLDVFHGFKFASSSAEIVSTSAWELSHRSFDPVVACADLKTGLSTSIPTVTVLDTVYYDAPTNVTWLGTCNPGVVTAEVPLCRLELSISTSETSNLTAEAWLPTEWNGRFLALGNEGLGGCIAYPNLIYGSKLNFATIGSNNGHDGDTGKYFGNPEVLADFTSRAIHVESDIGKQIVSHYYGKPQDKSYYLGCSTGGRQGAYAALHYPDDFDGIVAGAPATNVNHLNGFNGMITKHLGAMDRNATGSWLSNDTWDVVAAEVLNQCDELDGLKDGIIAEPDDCNFVPDVLLCSELRTENCLTKPQLDAVRKIYAPLYGNHGDFLFPRFDPGAEGATYARFLTFYGGPYASLLDWMKYVIKNDTNWNYSTFSIDDVYLMDKVDPGKISTYNGNLTAFKNRGGKFLTFHGRRDDIIPSGSSKQFYNLVSETMGMPSLDPFYRLFMIPGMHHCRYGLGPVNIGQYWTTYKSDDPKKNVLLALVDWVEKGVAPDTITGLSNDGSEERVHCRYPYKSVWNGTEYICVQ